MLFRSINLAQSLREIKGRLGAKQDTTQQARAGDKTDFSELAASFKITHGVARNDDFIAFARDVAMHVAAMPTAIYVTEDEVPAEAREAELRVYEQQAADKPENIRAKIAEGKLKKWLEEVVLLNQEHINGDKFDGKTIEQLRADLSAKTGENIVVKRFTRFAVGA